MSWLSSIGVIVQAVMLVLQYLKDRQTAGVATEKAILELKSILNAHIDAAVIARRQPDDPGVHDPFDRDE